MPELCYSLAPMEGVTGSIYRRTAHVMFAPFDRYYTPFLSPTREHILTARQWSEIDPARNEGLDLVPQILTNDADAFLWMAGELARLGYREVNLNLGCPSGTVVRKRKGSGLLAELPLLDALLGEIYARSPLPVSLKTRLGVQSEAEFEAILAIFDRYPVCELIIHPRVQRDQYRGEVRMEAFAGAFERSRAPVCYNGNIVSLEDVAGLRQRFPALRHIMLGRGALANPALIRRLRGGAWADAGELEAFHDSLYAQFRAEMPGWKPTLCKLWELWAFWGSLFASPEKALKRVRKATSYAEYEAAVKALFASCEFLPDGTYVIG